MLFNSKALTAKLSHLDEPLKIVGLVESVVARYLPGDARIAPLPRVWEPGGGATLYRIESRAGDYLLKVKHRDCLVESRLEAELDWNRKPSLQNEHEFLSLIKEPWVPRVVFFAERDGFQFLALEWLRPFHQAVKELGAVELLGAWRVLEDAARRLYEMNIVHTDIHEHNVCFRGAQPVLCDFEEARDLEQHTPFESSLDVVGENDLGNVGDFPEGHGGPPGFTCLKRLEKVFRALVAERLPALLADCRFDNECPFNLDAQQQPDERIYQSLSVGGVHVAGQRPARDSRHDIFRYLMLRLRRGRAPFRHIDVGSNLGIFCFLAGRYKFVSESLGVEAFEAYVNSARCLAFMLGARGVRFERLICGEDSLVAAFGTAEMVTVLSVYHHIKNKAAFLRDLRKLGPRQILVEFAIQERYYLERGGLAREMDFFQAESGLPCRETLAVSRDYHRPLVLFSREAVTGFDRLFIRLLNGRARRAARLALALLERRFLRRPVT